MVLQNKLGNIMNEFELFFKKLNIPVADLPNNYNPDDYAKQINQSANADTEISYSVSTKLEGNREIELSTIVYP